MCVLPVCMCVHHVQAWRLRQSEDPLELELRKVVGAGLNCLPSSSWCDFTVPVMIPVYFDQCIEWQPFDFGVSCLWICVSRMVTKMWPCSRVLLSHPEAAVKWRLSGPCSALVYLVGMLGLRTRCCVQLSVASGFELKPSHWHSKCFTHWGLTPPLM